MEENQRQVFVAKKLWHSRHDSGFLLTLFLLLLMFYIQEIIEYQTKNEFEPLNFKY